MRIRVSLELEKGDGGGALMMYRQAMMRAEAPSDDEADSLCQAFLDELQRLANSAFHKGKEFQRTHQPQEREE